MPEFSEILLTLIDYIEFEIKPLKKEYFYKVVSVASSSSSLVSLSQIQRTHRLKSNIPQKDMSLFVTLVHMVLDMKNYTGIYYTGIRYNNMTRLEVIKMFKQKRLPNLEFRMFLLETMIIKVKLYASLNTCTIIDVAYLRDTVLRNIQTQNLPPLILYKEDTCVICYDNDATVALNPCGHQCICRTCKDMHFKSINRCPVCRIYITNAIITNDDNMNMNMNMNMNVNDVIV